LYFLNNSNKSSHIIIVDKTNWKQIDKIELQRQGPNVINNPIGVFLFKGELAVYEFYTEGIKIIGNDGQILNTIKSKLESSSKNSTLIINTNPIQTLNETIILPNLGAADFKTKKIDYSEPILKIIDVTKGEISTLGSYPASYLKPLSGGLQSFFSLTSFNNKIVISFPLDHNLYEYNGEFLKEVTIQSTVFDSFDGHFFSSFGQITKANSQEFRQKFWANHSYWNVIHDPYKRVIYRVVNLPIKNVNSLKNTAQEKDHRKYQILVYDQDYNYLGKSNELSGLDLSYQSGKAFVSNQGLHVFKSVQDNEDAMQFKTLIYQGN